MIRPLLLLGLLASGATPAAEVLCHYDYGGVESRFQVSPTTDPYGVPARRVGSYLLLRVVWQRAVPELAAVNIYTYVDAPEGPAIIHQGRWPEAAPNGARYGFTGLQRVYEPIRDSEVQYWCEHAREAAK
jgi:hypothetical protein